MKNASWLAVKMSPTSRQSPTWYVSGTISIMRRIQASSGRSPTASTTVSHGISRATPLSISRRCTELPVMRSADVR